jgi:2-hydroxycyclohexanecarboxyl-CoA dehydrogenase
VSAEFAAQPATHAAQLSPVVVTGAAGGIGAEIARRVVRSGSTVALVDRDEDGMSRVAADLPGSASVHPCDLADREQVERTIGNIVGKWGPPRALVSAAGYLVRGAFKDADIAEQLSVLDVNLVGAIVISWAIIPSLLAGHADPRIVYIGSDSARAGVGDSAVYAAAKAGLAGFSRSLAVELARAGVTVNVVSAGSVDAPMLTRQYTADEIAKRARANPSGRLGTPADVAAAVEYFLSPAASYVTGQTLSVNGGMFRAG